jgi:L-threonylcarbamoyladenylate synthase
MTTSLLRAHRRGLVVSMRVITAADLSKSANHYNDIATTLTKDGLVCFPAGSAYRLAASLFSPEAVMRLVQSKRRASHHPALVFVADPRMLPLVVGKPPALARRLIDAFWPGPLTLLLDLSPDVPPKVARMLTHATGKVGVRCPEHAIAANIARTFGQPLLVSSANLENRTGAGSAAQVRKSFQMRVDLLVDAGDLPAWAPSTLVEITPDGWQVTREGAITPAAIERALV